MVALHGKLAWQFLSNSSLWARHARSRFSVGGRGSCLWKSISPLISSISLNCRWIIGNGQTKLSVFCQNLSMPFPKRFKNLSIKEVLHNSELRRVFLHNVNPRIFRSIEGNMLAELPDRLVWEGDPAGYVTTANFLESFAPPAPPNKRFEILWHSWLPVNISCFLWRILYSAIPTHENIMSTGVNLVSRCVCCLNPKTESMEHLFLLSDHAVMTLNFLCPIFGKNRPITLHQLFYYWGYEADFSNFTDCLGFGILCCCLWDIWKLRNQIFHDDFTGKYSKCNIYRWASLLSGIIKVSPVDAKLTRDICNALHINPARVMGPKLYWIPWQPSRTGSTCNIAISIEESRSRMAAIVRDSSGIFVVGLKIVSVSKNFFRCLFHILQELFLKHINFKCLKLSHSDTILLGRGSFVDWSSFQLKRKIAQMIKGAELSRVCQAVNRPAETLLCAKLLQDLPRSAIKALANDANPHPCLLLDQIIYF